MHTFIYSRIMLLCAAGENKNNNKKKSEMFGQELTTSRQWISFADNITRIEARMTEIQSFHWNANAKD